MWTREQFKMNAKINFKRNYWPCVAVAFIMAVVEGLGATNAGGNASQQSVTGNGYFEGGSNGIWPALTSAIIAIGITMLVLGALLNILVGNVLRIGANKFFIQNRTSMPRVNTIFDGFRFGNYGNVVLTMFLKDLYVTLWTLLFIIPGIIKEYEYLMVPYILAENPGMNQKEAFSISKRMMDGEKWNAFVLQISFIGWAIVGALTCGLAGIFYVSPYREATMAELYAYNKGKAYQEGYIR